MVVAAGVAVTLAVKDFIRLALACARRTLQDLASRASAAVVAVVDHVAGAD